jgi:predicted acyltransferase
VPAVATALFGVFAGDWLKASRQLHRSAWLFAAGIAAVAIASAWNRVFPINKNLWTSSFALLSAGIAAQTLAVCHWIVDVYGWRTWSRPLVAYGRNPLAAYFFSVGCDSLATQWIVADRPLKSLVHQRVFASWIQPRLGADAASLAYALAYVALWGIVLWQMYRRRVFIGI